MKAETFRGFEVALEEKEGLTAKLQEKKPDLIKSNLWPWIGLQLPCFILCEKLQKHTLDFFTSTNAALIKNP